MKIETIGKKKYLVRTRRRYKLLVLSKYTQSLDEKILYVPSQEDYDRLKDDLKLEIWWVHEIKRGTDLAYPSKGGIKSLATMIIITKGYDDKEFDRWIKEIRRFGYRLLIRNEKGLGIIK